MNKGVSILHPRASNYMKSFLSWCPFLLTLSWIPLSLVLEVHLPTANVYFTNLHFGVRMCFVNAKVCVVIW